MRRTVTIAVRLVAFAVAMAPLAALFMPWITLDGNQRSYTGVTSVALLVSPIREYLYAVDPVRAAIVTLSPLLIVLLSIVTSSYYYKRRAILWAPPAILAVALAVIYMTADLTNGLHLGPPLRGRGRNPVDIAPGSDTPAGRHPQKPKVILGFRSIGSRNGN